MSSLSMWILCVWKLFLEPLSDTFLWSLCLGHSYATFDVEPLSGAFQRKAMPQGQNVSMFHKNDPNIKVPHKVLHCGTLQKGSKVPDQGSI